MSSPTDSNEQHLTLSPKMLNILTIKIYSTMKKEYLKPIAIFHELRCSRIMNASQAGEEGKLQMGNSFFGPDPDSDSDSDGDYFYNPIVVE